MKKAIFFALLGIVLIVALIGGGKALQIRDLIAAGESMSPPPITVSSELATEIDWDTSLKAFGSLEAAQGGNITADIAGRIKSIEFEAGTAVEAGELLVEQETSTELAQLEAAEADLSLAQSNLTRVYRLYQQKLTSRSEYDSARAAFQSASAQAENVKTVLEKKRIVAPFAGRLGLRQVDIGQNISAGTVIVSLQAADPMLINFSMPQQNLQQLKPGYKVDVTTDALPGETFSGEISAIDTEIDSSTRTVSVQASLPNPDGKLLPGMFANVTVNLPESRNALIIPITAVSYASYGDSVFVIEPSEEDDSGSTLIARQQFVQLGEAKGDFVSVLVGLEPQQRVASAGVFKLRNGATVVLNEEVKSELSLNPKLADN